MDDVISLLGPATRRSAKNQILALARRYGVAYVATARDRAGNDMTRLSGDDVELDKVEETLLALERAGKLSSPEADRFTCGLYEAAYSVNFDPFGDFDTKGYLRNFQKLKEAPEIKRLEHRHFLKNLNRAAANLAQVKQLSYQDVLNTHKILFAGVYPWAGEDRAVTAPDIAVAKGGLNDLFAHPQDCQRAIDRALKLGQDRDFMAEHPGTVMGYLAHGHPFLDGNGRTIMTVHNELAHRADISIDWAKVEKGAYLGALTRELANPDKCELDKFLKPYIDRAVSRETMTQELGQLRGLGSDPGDDR